MFDWPLLLWWPLLAGALYTLRALRTPRSLGLMFAHLSWLSTVALAGGITLLRVLADRADLADGWLLPAVLAPLAVLFVLAGKRPAIGCWPVADQFPRWRMAWLAMAGLGLGLGWLFGNFLPGDSNPLPWLPLLNPLELWLVLGLLVAAMWLRNHSDPHRLGWLAWAGAALFLLSMGVLRACHHLGGLPSALPYILAGMKLSGGLALIGAVVAEFVAGSGAATGLAWRIVEAGNRLDIPRMFAALFLLSMSVLRACHQLGGLPWSPDLLGETAAQASLTIAWGLAGVTAWVMGSRRGDRALWWFGAALLGVVLLKLLFVDRHFVGNVAGIVSFVVVGLLLIVVGRIAPTPPRRSE